MYPQRARDDLLPASLHGDLYRRLSGHAWHRLFSS